MTDLIARYRRFAGEHYQRDGRPTAEIAKIRDALKPVERLYGDRMAADFGPLAYKTVRAEFIQAIQRTASMNRRLFLATFPCWPGWPGRWSLIRSQSASLIAWRDGIAGPLYY